MAEMRAVGYQNAATHGSTRAAFTNCFTNPGQPVSLLGFGQPGVLFTGDADGGVISADHTQYIGFVTTSQGESNNFTHVGTLAQDLRPKVASELWLAGCNTGAGDAGKRLLVKLSTLLQIPVSAPSGFIFPDAACETLYLQEGTAWLTVQPNSRLDSVTAMTPPVTATHRKDFITLRQHGLEAAVDVSASLVQRLWLRQTHYVHPEWSKGLAQQALQFVHLDAPLSAGPFTPAVETGTVRLTLESEAGGTSHREFRLLNDYFLQDVDYPDTYYPINITDLVTAMTPAIR